jgi:hypothetical protein
MSDDDGWNPGRKKGSVQFYPTVTRFVRLSRRFDDFTFVYCVSVDMKRKRDGIRKFFRPIGSSTQSQPHEQVDDLQAGEENDPNSTEPEQATIITTK